MMPASAKANNLRECDKAFLSFRRRCTLHPLDWGFLVCCLLIVSGTIAIAVAMSLLGDGTGASPVVTVSDVWPEIDRDLTALTWAHGTNSGAKQALIQGSSHHQQQPPIKIAAINGKPRVQRYLSKECEFAGCILPLVKEVENNSHTLHACMAT